MNLDPNIVVPLVFSVLAFLTVIGLGLPWLQPDIFANRLKVIRKRREELSQQRRQRLEHRPALRRQAFRVDVMRAVLGKLKVKNLTQQPALKRPLVRARWGGPAPPLTLTLPRPALP